MRQDEATAIASSSCYCVLVSSVKSSLNKATKRSILRSNNKKKISGRGLASGEEGTPLGVLGASTNASSAFDQSSLPPLKLKPGYARENHYSTLETGALRLQA